MEAITVTGLADVQKALYAYSQKLGDAVVYKALKAGANVVKRQAVANAPKGKTLRLKKGIFVANSKINRGRTSKDLIGVYLSIRSKKKTDPFYGRFIEDGWNTHGVRIGSRAAIVSSFGKRTGRSTQRGKTDVAGQGFIESAWQARRAQAVEMTVRTAEAAADLLAKKMGL
jgi:hypothetical protein